MFFSFSAVFRERVRLVGGAILVVALNRGRAINGRRAAATRAGMRVMPILICISSYLTWTVGLFILAFIGGCALRGEVLLVRPACSAALCLFAI
jgi:hypothetical protein